jgi:hypothetical protein
MEQLLVVSAGPDRVLDNKYSIEANGIMWLMMQPTMRQRRKTKTAWGAAYFSTDKEQSQSGT